MMAEKLDSETFVSELCSGFRLLANPMKGLITSESLRKNSALLVLKGMSEKETKPMIR